MRNLKELNKEELNKLNGGCFSFDVGYAIQWFAGLSTPAGIKSQVLEAAYDGMAAQHQH